MNTKTKTEAKKPEAWDKHKRLAVETCEFVPITSIVPESWRTWFFGAISEGAPFSWGDNNRTMVDAISFRNHADDVLELQDGLSKAELLEKEAFFDTLNYLAAKNIYIDLEN